MPLSFLLLTEHESGGFVSVGRRRAFGGGAERDRPHGHAGPHQFRLRRRAGSRWDLMVAAGILW